jgi:flagellar biosynthesis anti-sigma factor FlgM
MNISSNDPPESRSSNRSVQDAQKIADVMSAVSLLPDVREARVREIKRAVDAGAYIVDPWRIAESMLKNVWPPVFSIGPCGPDEL